MERSINEVLSRSIPAEWRHAELVREMHDWATVFSREFALGVPTPAICIERLRGRRLGRFRLVRNGFGLQDEIAIDERHAASSPRWRVLGTLLHEMLHQWQLARNGRCIERRWARNYHDAEFRRRAKELGLDVDAQGRTTYPEGATPFRELLRSRGVALDDAPATRHPIPTRRTLALWTCACSPPVRLRIGRRDVRIRCEDCGELFTSSESTGGRFWDAGTVVHIKEIA